MEAAGYTFEVRAFPTNESFPSSLPPTQVAAYLSKKKNKIFREAFQTNRVILTSDTTVLCKNLILEKPNDAEEAVWMLQQLSDTQHQVITGVTISSEDSSITLDDTTIVTFRKLSNEEIIHYVENFQPFDKAGAYAIQEWIGMIGIKKIEGSYYNVVGLPLEKVYDVLLKEFQITPLH
jgi:septum formation protein